MYAISNTCDSNDFISFSKQRQNPIPIQVLRVFTSTPCNKV